MHHWVPVSFSFLPYSITLTTYLQVDVTTISMMKDDGGNERGDKKWETVRGNETSETAPLVPQVSPPPFIYMPHHANEAPHGHPMSLDDEDAPHHNTRTTWHPPLPCEPLLAGWITGADAWDKWRQWGQ
jgi:hypothetical protein